MAVQQVLVNVLMVVFAVLGMFIVFRWVLPKVADLLDAVVEDQVAVDGVMVLLKIFVGVFVLGLVITNINGLIPSIAVYLNTIQQGISVVNSMVKYVEWLVVGAGALLLMKMWKK